MQFFLTSNSVYIIVFNAASAVAGARVDYWMRQIRAMSGNSNRAPIFLVGTHIDDPICTAEYLDRLSATLAASYHKYCFCGFRGLSFVSCRTAQGMASFKEQLYSVLVNKKLFSTVVPDSWVNLHNAIQRRGEPQVDWCTYCQWAMQCGIVGEQGVKLVTEFLADVGTLLYFPDEGIDLVVLKPQWLADIMSSLITFRHGWIKQGMLPETSLRMVFEAYPESLHSTLLALLKRFEVLYPVTIPSDAIASSSPPPSPSSSSSSTTTTTTTTTITSSGATHLLV
jgi:hypothetical protein